MLSKPWAKSVAGKWHNIMTTANAISKERTPEEVVAGTPKTISSKGVSVIFNLFMNAGMDSVGANIASQTWNSLSEKDFLEMVNNVAKELGLSSYQSVENFRKTDSSGLRLK